ncbi:MAG: ATP-binding cassette domain-containing protein [Saprospiraceae bacterium]|nr:ATP-binding cassette domain-containing protein [Saprospiraceae bacterium]
MKEITFKSLLAKLLEFKSGILYSFILYFIWTFIEISIPFLTQLIVDEGIFYSDHQFIVMIIGAIVMFNIGGMLADFSKTWIMRNIGVRMNIHVIEDYYKKLLGKQMLEFNKINEGKVIQNINDNIRIENFLTKSLISFINSLFSLSVFCLILFFFDGTIAFIFLISLVILVVWDVIFLGTRERIDEERFQMSSRVQNEVIQSVKGIFDIKVNEIEQHQFDLWHQLHQYTSNVRLKILKLAQLYKGGNTVTSEIRDGVILILACYGIIQGDMSIGTLLAIQYILGRSRQPVLDLLQVIQDRQDATLSLKRLKNIYNEKGVVERVPGRQIEADVHMENATFYYPDSKKGVEAITLQIPFGSNVALIGESGNGKSTLINLILGLFKPDSGKIVLRNGDQTHSVDVCSFGALSQDGHIFSESLLYNITFCMEEDTDYEKFTEVLRVACLTEVVAELPEKHSTLLGKDGVKLSKGQFQRILVARALYRESGILILDEPTSALDNKTSKKMVENILEYCKNKTLIVATHKLFLASKMDKVIVLDNGHIVKEIDQEDKGNVDLNEYLV